MGALYSVVALQKRGARSRCILNTDQELEQARNQTPQAECKSLFATEVFMDDDCGALSGYRALPEDIAITRRARELGVLETPSGFLFYEGQLLTGTVNGHSMHPVHFDEAREVVRMLIERCLNLRRSTDASSSKGSWG